MAHRPNRRGFLKQSAVLGGGFWVAGAGAAEESKSPNEKLNIGIVGVNSRGRANTGGVRSENIVALCDIDDNYLNQASKQFPKAARFNDWRKLCEQKNIDAVVISTADHTHAAAAVAAMRSGKHVYCEKPLAHTVEEARIVRETYRASKVATQMGTQIHATDNYRRVVELVQSGAIGTVREAHVWCGRTSGEVGVLPTVAEIPKHLHWDLWLGPTADRGFNPGYLPGNLTWNRWWDFGNGVLGDMGSHLIDLPYWALDLKHPTKCSAEGPPVHQYSNPPWMIVNWQHPPTDRRAAVTLKWYHHKKRPKSPPGINLAAWHIGVMFVGDEGQLVADYGRRVLLPAEKYKDFQAPPKTIPKSLGHHREWINAAKTGAPTLCNFEYSGALIEHNLLGNVAYRLGEEITWDAEKLEAKNLPEAERYIKKRYRKGWDIHA
ncbi:MAG: Gfo/Idh/MocA family oxidoreductase [Planctomycetota bacterium]|nr:Gfo/Idh/MocA family oxidoreductase [Planctomycetota bacterium]